MSNPEADRLSEADLRFEQRAQTLLLESVDRLPAQVRSRLNRARHEALAARPSRSRSLVRQWVPAGAAALAVAVLAVMVIGMPHQAESPAATNPLVAASPEDLEMLADSDAVQLGRDEDIDYDFYEWAVGEAAKGASAPTEGP